MTRHVTLSSRRKPSRYSAPVRSSSAVLDDHAARRLASQHGVRVIGSLRVIVRAKERGLIPLARPVLEKLRGGGAYVSDELIDRAIALAGET